MSNSPAHVIADAFTEVQAVLHDHLEFGVGVPADVLARINRILSERTLIRAMYDAGCFPANNPPEEVQTGRRSTCYRGR